MEVVDTKAAMWKFVCMSVASCNTCTMAKFMFQYIMVLHLDAVVLEHVSYLGSDVGATWICCSSATGRPKQ